MSRSDRKNGSRTAYVCTCTRYGTPQSEELLCGDPATRVHKAPCLSAHGGDAPARWLLRQVIQPPSPFRADSLRTLYVFRRAPTGLSRPADITRDYAKCGTCVPHLSHRCARRVIRRYVSGLASACGTASVPLPRRRLRCPCRLRAHPCARTSARFGCCAWTCITASLRSSPRARVCTYTGRSASPCAPLQRCALPPVLACRCALLALLRGVYKVARGCRAGLRQNLRHAPVSRDGGCGVDRQPHPENTSSALTYEAITM